MLFADKVNRFIPNPTFDPVIVPGCIDLYFRGKVPKGVDPKSLSAVELLQPALKDDRVDARRLRIMQQPLLHPRPGG